MAYLSIGEYTSGTFTYELFSSALGIPFGFDLGFRVLDHIERKGFPDFNHNKIYYPTDVTVYFFDKDGSVYDYFKAATDKKFKLVITDSATNFSFTGLYVPGIDQRSLFIGDMVISMVFADRLNLLKEKTYELTDFYTWADFLRTMLDELGYSLPIKTNFNVKHENIATGKTVENHKVVMQGLLERKPEATYYDALLEFCNTFKAWLFQDEGCWFIWQYSERDQTLIENIATDGMVTTIYETISKTLNKFVNPQSEKDDRGLVTYERTELYNNEEFAIKNSDFSSQLDEWDTDGDIDPFTSIAEGSGAQINDINDNFSQTIKRALGARSVVKVSYKFEIEVNDVAGTYNLDLMTIKLQNNNSDVVGEYDNYWIDEDGASSIAPLNVNKEFTIATNTGGHITLIFEEELTFTTSVNFIGFLKVTGFSENESFIYTADGWYIRFYEINVEFVKGLPQPNTELPMLTEADDNDPGVALTDQVYLSDSQLYKRFSDFSYKVTGTSNFLLASSWTSSKHAGYDALSKIVIDNYMRRFGTGLTQYKLHVKFNKYAGFRNLLYMNPSDAYLNYVPYYIQRSARQKKWKLYVIEYPDDQDLA